MWVGNREYLTVIEMSARIHRRIKEFGSYAAYSRHLGISPSTLHRALAGDIEVSKPILHDLGVTRLVFYRVDAEPKQVEKKEDKK